jgi:hypothetical protein
MRLGKRFAGVGRSVLRMNQVMAAETVSLRSKERSVRGAERPLVRCAAVRGALTTDALQLSGAVDEPEGLVSQ